MPMIDVYAGAGVFDNTKELARSLAAAVMAVEEAELVQAARAQLAQPVEAPTAAEA
jgi:hypothetical protein